MREQDVQTIVQDLFRAMQIEAELSIALDSDGVTWWANVSSRDGHLFLARGGEGLVAVNHVIKEMARKQMQDKDARPPVIVDINGFQKKRADTLKTTAHMMAERARFFKSSVSLDPMSPYDRRIVHEHLSNAKDIKTESEGQGRDRHVVIRYVEPTSDNFS